MIIDFNELLNEAIDAISLKKIWVVATSANNHVTARSMSIVNDGLSIYFQTHTSYIKYKQIEQNKNVALCNKNIQIEGEAIICDNAYNGKNKKFLELYKRDHPDSYKRYTKLEGQVVIKINPKIIKFWKYINNLPYIEILDILNNKAERILQKNLPL